MAPGGCGCCDERAEARAVQHFIRSHTPGTHLLSEERHSLQRASDPVWRAERQGVRPRRVLDACRALLALFRRGRVWCGLDLGQHVEQSHDGRTLRHRGSRRGEVRGHFGGRERARQEPEDRGLVCVVIGLQPSRSRERPPRRAGIALALVAYFECLHELKLIVDLFYQGGLSYMRYSVSDTAEYGDYSRGPRVIDEHVRATMKQILKEVQDGTFAKQWIAENEAGRPNFKKMRETEADLQIEKVGKQLREMMSFLQKPKQKAAPIPAAVGAREER